MGELIGQRRFQRLFSRVAGLEVAKEDLPRLDAFVNRKIYALLVRAQVTARENGRGVIHASDLPVTDGLHRQMGEYAKHDADFDVEPIGDRLAPMPKIRLDLTPKTEAKLPFLVGALSVAVAKGFNVLDPDLTRPQLDHWDRVCGILDLGI